MNPPAFPRTGCPHSPLTSCLGLGLVFQFQFWLLLAWFISLALCFFRNWSRVLEPPASPGGLLCAGIAARCSQSASHESQVPDSVTRLPAGHSSDGTSSSTCPELFAPNLFSLICSPANALNISRWDNCLSICPTQICQDHP